MMLYSLGGPVLLIIIVLGLVGAGVYLERTLKLHRARIDVRDFLHGIFNSLRRNYVTEAIALCEETPGPVARLLAVAIQHRKDTRADLLLELDQTGRSEIARMERRLSVLALIAQTAPLLGLLGTVLGILKALIVYRANLPLVQTGDIADALILGAVTTAAGLIVAIPCHFGFNLLIVKIDRLVVDMREACSEAIRMLENLYGTGAPAPAAPAAPAAATAAETATPLPPAQKNED